MVIHNFFPVKWQSKTVDIVEGTEDATCEHRNEFDDGNTAIEQFCNEDEDGSIMNEDDDYNDEDSDDPGMASVGKKIWTFFTT